MLYDARSALTQEAEKIADNAPTLTERDVARAIESFDVSLLSVIGGLQFPGIWEQSPEIRNRLLFGPLAGVRYLASSMR